MLLLGQLRVQVAEAMNGAVLTVGARPELLDRPGQSGRAVGDDNRGAASPRVMRSRPSSSQSSFASRAPNLTETSAGGRFGDASGADHALLRAARADREVDRVEEQHDQLDS